jgi:hypothetical protein
MCVYEESKLYSGKIRDSHHSFLDSAFSSSLLRHVYYLSILVGFVVDKVALEQIFSEFYGFPLSISFHHHSPYSYIIWGMNNMSVSGSSAET